MEAAALSKCVGCDRQQTDGRVKLLRCLHTLCIGCVESHFTRKNEILCPACTTRTPIIGGKLFSLPDVFPADRKQEAESSEQSSKPLHCDECFEEKEAVSTCLDCGRLLCEEHGKSHPLFRASYKHRVSALGEAATSEPPATVCPVHSGQKLRSFCTGCSELLCEACEATACERAKSHTALPLEEAEKLMKEKIQTELKQFRSSSYLSDTMSRAVKNIDNSIQKLHDETNMASEKAAEFYESVVAAVKERQAEVLNNLDLLRTTKLRALEKQKQDLEKGLSAARRTSLLLEQNEKPLKFLQMAGWLSKAAKEAADVAKGDFTPCKVTDVKFLPRRQKEVFKVVAEAGTALDAADIDFNGTLAWSPPAQIGEELVITVKPDKVSGHSLSSAMATKSSLHISLVGPNLKSVPLKLVPAQEGKSFTAKVWPSLSGEHQISALYGGRHLRHSPLKLNVLPRPRCLFDPKEHSNFIAISEGQSTAEYKKFSRGSESGIVLAGGSLAACSPTYKNGRASIMLRLHDRYNEMKGMCVFMCKASENDFDSLKKIHGWQSDESQSSKICGTRLGQPWQDGDELHLVLDCEQHTLTGHHCRTGEGETLQGLEGELRLYVSMCKSGQRVVLL